MKKTTLRLWICGVLLAGVLAFIWGNSLLPARDSGQLSGWVGTLIGKLLPFLSLDTGSGLHLLRKAAHFCEFAALGLCLTWLFGMLMKKPAMRLGFPMLGGVVAACVDETIQIFSPGRFCSAADVALDSCGVLTGLVLMTLCAAIFASGKHKNT